MFYDVEAFVLNENKEMLAKIMVDMQPYDKTMQFEENIEIDINYRVFCDNSEDITLSGYIMIDSKYYKIMHIRKWNSYLECWLYQCEGENDETN